MGEPVFFERGPGFTVADLVALTGARSRYPIAADARIADVAALDRAGPHDVTFVDGTSNESALRLTQAGACFVPERMAASVPLSVSALVVDDPYRAFVRAANALYPQARRPSSLFEVRGAAGSALVHPTARVEAGVTIDPAAMIGPRAEIGAGTLIGPMAVIGPGVRIGRDCSIEPGASLTHALVGDKVVIEAGCRIGLAGHAARLNDEIDDPKLGRVILQDKVILGANATIDRGGGRDTIIGEGTVIDSLVHIPSGTLIGRYCRIMTGNGQLGSGERATDFQPCADGLRVFAWQVGRADVSQARGAM